MATIIGDEQLSRALLDPASEFEQPLDIVKNSSLSNGLKIQLLKRWEYDAREMQVAEEEGFPPQQPGCLLDAVLVALHQLGAGPDLEHTPPTKQGGV